MSIARPECRRPGRPYNRSHRAALLIFPPGPPTLRYTVKAAVQRAFSVLPLGDQLNYVFQRHVTHSFPQRDSTFENKVRRAGQHFDFLRRFLDQPPGEARCYEIGAGWDLAIPLTYWMLGIEHQLLVDIRRNVRLELINHSIDRLTRGREHFETIAGAPLRELAGPVTSVDALETRYGIRWLAPADATATGLPSGSLDFISNTSTLEHIPPPTLAGILKEWRRTLRPGGIAACHVDMKDHYAGFDKSITHYNFLTHSEASWRPLNPSLHYQNRLRRPDYLTLVADAGFELVHQECIAADADDLAILSRLPIAPEFRDYSTEDLGVKTLWLVLINPA